MQEACTLSLLHRCNLYGSDMPHSVKEQQKSRSASCSTQLKLELGLVQQTQAHVTSNDNQKQVVSVETAAGTEYIN